MTRTRRVLNRLTLRQVAAALLIACFTEEIVTFLRWLAATGQGVVGEGSVHGLLLAALSFALDVAFIYLALRGLGLLLARSRREGEAPNTSDPGFGDVDPPSPFDGRDRSPEQFGGLDEEAQ